MPAIHPSSPLPSLASSVPDSLPSVAVNFPEAVGAVELTGIGLESIQSGTLELEIPLRKGSYTLPGDFADAQIKVNGGTTARVRLEMGTSDNGEPQLMLLEAVLTKPLVIANPASAFEPSSTSFDVLNTILDYIKDLLGDYCLEAITMQPNGDVKLDGYIDLPGPINPDKSRIVAHLERNLKTAFDIASEPSPAAAEATPANNLPIHSTNGSANDAFSALTRVLREVGAMTGEATYKLRGTTNPVRVGLHGDAMDLSSSKKAVTIEANGRARINEDGTIHADILNDAVPTLSTGFGHVNTVGFVDLTVDGPASVSGDGELGFSSALRHVTGTLHPTAGLNLPVSVAGADAIGLRGRGVVAIRNNGFSLRNGDFSASLDNKVDRDTAIAAHGARVFMKDGRLKLQFRGEFESNANFFKVTGGAVDASLAGEDTWLETADFRGRIDGLLRASLEARGIRLNSETGTANGGGKFTWNLDPRSAHLREERGLDLFKQTIEFEMREDGTLKIIPGPGGATDFFAPFLNVAGKPDRIVDPMGPAAAPVGSSEMMTHIENLTGAKALPNNGVELLIDGVQSYPKRLEMIRNAESSICLQALIFKGDDTGMETARELVNAAKRGVDVRVIVDCLGNVEKIPDLTEGKELYRFLRQGGVKVGLYNDPRKNGFADVIEAIKLVPELAEIAGPQDLQDPEIALKVFQRLMRVSFGETSASVVIQTKIRDLLRTVAKSTPGISSDEVELITTGRVMDVTHAVLVAKLAAELNHRWHEKHLVVDGKQAILGGMNIGDEYMLGGTGATATFFGMEKEAWRDTDIFIEGAAAGEAYAAFARNWLSMTGDSMPTPKAAVVTTGSGDTTVQVVQHRPRVDGDHNITNVMIENLKALKTGDKAYIANAYFLPTGALESVKTALMQAAKRGVDVRILTNAESTTDLAQINQAAIFPYRDLLGAGVKIFEVTGSRTMHSKVAVFGGNTAVVGSWNMDNRSASLNSEVVAIAYGDRIGSEVEAMVLNDMRPDVAREIKLEDIDSLAWDTEIRNSAVAVLSDFM